MRKRVLYEVGALLLLCLALSGCSGAELLEQVPRDLVMTNREAEANEREPGGQEDSGGPKEDSGAGTPSETRAPDPEQSFLCEGAFEYARQSLDQPGQQWYDDMKRILGDLAPGSGSAPRDCRQGTTKRI